MSNSKDKFIHIVSFDIPIPVNYGGAIDVYYKLKALKEIGMKVIFHCFKYGGRSESEELKELCHEVYYYKRKKVYLDFFYRTPYIVSSRHDKQLLSNLNKDNYPIIFEGIHSTYYLNHFSLKKRRKLVRTHNIEHEYYSCLSSTEKNFFRKYYFKTEAKRLKSYEEVLHHANSIAAISKNDYLYFSSKYENVSVISAFHPNENIEILEGKGNYILYHGSLEVNENHQAAMYLIKEVFQGTAYKLIIAGNKPKTELLKIAKEHDNVEIRVGISNEEIVRLVKEAQINILPTFQATGIKLKLLLALYCGRHCIVNSPMVLNTGLEELCVIAENPKEMLASIEQLFNIEIEKEDIEKRKKVLVENGFMNKINAERLMIQLFP